MKIDAIPHGSYTHDVLIHHTDDELVAATMSFVESGLNAGGHVLVHSFRERLALLRSAVGTHPRLEYALDEDLYVSPMSTLFGYERSVAQREGPGDFWVVGTVPFGPDVAGHAAWTRYESLVNEVLGGYPFHALCTYDTRALPADTVAAALATHAYVSDGVVRTGSPSYVDPGRFLADARAEAPHPPDTEPLAGTVLHGGNDLSRARRLLRRVGRVATALDPEAVDGFVVAVNEVLDNGLRHGRPPVELRVWAEPATLCCLVLDSGPGLANPLSGYRYPELGEPAGLWVARQFCEELVVRNRPGGAEVFLTTG
ncbi:MAG TPA: MEDS domain-containing protein [Jatrophihabitans sp.]|nr:MEDS domain-containing protein [Jatrophihabitans sp.]